MHVDELVHRPFHLAIVDEADSLMIDEARVPLVIAGSVDTAAPSALRLAGFVATLVPDIHFEIDEYARNVQLTDAGVEHAERTLASGDLHREGNIALLTELNCALHARVLLRRDVDYIVRQGRIELVDEHTGRVVADRHWPDGLQAALEAKEGLTRGADGRILASITLQRFFSGYTRLCGMTGTAADAAEELSALYDLPVAIVPTHAPIVRLDRDDLVFTHREARNRAVVDEVCRAHAVGRPVLVGTATISDSEQLAEQLGAAGVACDVLNAKHDAEEAVIVARAGALGAVTIATNMAGRGTDIRLGGADEADYDRVAGLGGLYVIGTNRHESRRVDLQLRGRAGRQGDPGESRFFVSLDDELLQRYGIRHLIPEKWYPPRSDAPVDSRIVRREVARAQRIVDGQNREIRQTLARYSVVVEDGSRRIGERRRALLVGDEQPDLWQQAPDQRDALASRVGDAAVVEAERTVTLACIDRAWRDHLALCADLREGIHLVRLGGQDPLSTFTSEVIRAYATLDETIDASVMAALPKVRITDGQLDLSETGLTRPSATWTYLVNDDPFKSRIGALLTGPGRVSIGIFAAALMMPLLVLWGVVEKGMRRRRGQ
jgi:preprotein translocase subunit SecA